MKSILDPSFKYTSSALTDVGATFRRVRRRIKEEEERQRLADEERARREAEQVTPIRRKGNA